MSTTIDNRVVEMQFNNQRFEQNVHTTLNTLDKLKEKLNLTGAAKGLENIDATSKKMNFSGLGAAVETIHTKFSALEVMGVTALANITNSAVNAGKRIVSALTIDPIKTGFQEYETQINSVQTILANTESKGTTLQDVNSALDTLNTYADKTIYNFTQMTRNIGTFTAAGVDLDTSVKSIQGIANLAAVSGSTSQQASTAMYQLSQALAAGRVSLMDWNSVVNAGMGGQVFQDALKRTAKNMGKDVDGIIAKYGSFRESLSKGEWLTTDVLTKTLEQFTMAAEEGSEAWESYKKSLIDDGYTEEQAVSILKMANTATDAATKVKTFTQLWDTLKESAQSGWTQTWEIIMGDFGEAKEFLTKISETIGGMLGASADARNALLSGGLSSGWKQLLGAGIADEAGYTEMFKSVANEHGVSIDEMIKAEKELDGSLSDTEAFQKVLKKGLNEGTISSDMLTESVGKLAEKMSNMSAEEREAAGYTVEHVEQIKKLNEGLQNGTISMDEFAKKIMRPSGRENLIESLWNSFEALMSVIKPVKEAFREIFPPMTAEQLYKMTESLKEFTSKLKLSEESSEKLKTVFKGIFSVLDIGWTFIKELGGGIVDIVKNFTGFGGSVLDIAASFGEWLTNLRDTVKNTDILGIAVEKITTFISNAIDKIKEFGKAVKKSFTTVEMDGFLKFFGAIWNIVKTMGAGVAKILAPIGKSIAGLFENANLFDVLNSGMLAGAFVGIQKFAGGFKGIFESVLGKDGLIDSIKGTLDDIRGCFEAYQNNLNAETLKKIAVAIAILAGSIFVLSSIEPEALDRSVAAMALLFGELLGAFALFTKIDTKGIKGALTKTLPLMIGMSIAIAILAGALKKVSTIPWEDMFKGLVGVGVLMGELSLFLRTFKFDGKLAGAAVGMVILSSAMLILAKAVENFGNMKIDVLAKGLAAIGALLLELGLFTKLTGNAKHVIATGTSMVILGAAMKIFVSVMKDFGSMKLETIGKGLAAMGGALAELTLAMRLMPKNAVGIGVGLIAVGAAMMILTKVLGDFGNMKVETIAKGLITMGIALAELTVALRLMNGTLGGSAALIIAAGALAIMVPVLKSLGEMSVPSIAKSLVTLAAAFAVVGAAGYLLGPVVPAILGLAGAFALFGIATLGIGVGLMAIAAGFTALATAGAAGATAFVAALTVIVVGILDLIPTIASKLGEAILTLCKVLVECAPEIAETILVVLYEVLNSLAVYTPQIIDSLFTFVIGLLDGLAARMPELIQSAVNLIGAFFRGVVDALKGIDTTSLIEGIVGVGLLAGLMWALSMVAGLVPGAMVGVLGMGLVIAELALVLAAIGALAQIPGLSWLIEEGGDFLQKIGTAIGQFVGGIVGGIAEGATSTLPQVGTNLSEFMTNAQPFFDGAKNIDASVLEGVKAIAGAVLALTGANLIESLTSWLTGGSSLAAFGKELAEFGPYMAQYASAVAGIDAASVVASATAAKALVKVAEAIPNEGGIVSWFTGDNDLGDFAAKLVPFGASLKAYSVAVAGIDSESVLASVSAAKAIVKVAEAIPNSGGLVSLFTGDNDLTSFAVKLIPFGAALKAYSVAVAGIDVGSINLSVSAAKNLVNLINSMSDIDTKGVAPFVTAMNTLGKTSVDGFINAFKKASVELASLGGDIFKSIAKGMNTSQDVLNKAATPALKSLMKCFSDKKDDFMTTGEKLMTQFINGIKSKGVETGNALSAPFSASLTKIRGYYSSFYDTGAYITSGLARGMSSKLSTVKTAANAIAAAAEKAARAALLVKSPSRVFYAIGEFVVEGFTNALSDGAGSVYSTASDMADFARTGFNNAVSKINDMIDSGMDTQPTIRPILDLSDVESGANRINGMFGMTPSVGVMSNISAINSAMSQRNQNGNSDIVSELTKLRKDLGNVGGGNTYNINGITYEEGSTVSNAISTLIGAIVREGRS